MPTDRTKLIAQAGQNFAGNFAVCTPNYPEGGWTTPKTLGRRKQALYLAAVVSVLMLMVSVPTPVSAQRPTHTINKPAVGVGPGTPQAIWKRCGEVAPDVSYLIPRNFGGRTEASGTGGYGYQPSADCPYWVVDFLMNRFSHTTVDQSGRVTKNPVIFSGDAFDLPSSIIAGGVRPIVEEDCKRMEVDVFIYRKAPNENKFKIIKTINGRFAAWDNVSKGCGLTGLAGVISERAPTANMLKIRIAVRVKLRDSWQQAAGYAQLAPPS